jgi:hypothetical protein
MNYTLTQQQLQSVLDYLTKRPYLEVHQLVSMIVSIQPNKEETDVTPKPQIVRSEEAKQA